MYRDEQFGQVIDVFVSQQRDAKAARRFFERAIGTTKVTPVEVTIDKVPVYPGVLEALTPAVWHRTDQYANNGIECDAVPQAEHRPPAVQAPRALRPTQRGDHHSRLTDIAVVCVPVGRPVPG